MTSWHNDDPPRVGVLRSRVRKRALSRAAPGADRLHGLIAAFDELLGRPVSMRALALLRMLAGAIVLVHLEPFLSDGLDGRTYLDAFHEPYANWYPEVPEGVYVGLLCLGAVAAITMSLGFLARLDRDHVLDRHLPLSIDHALPQQPGLPGDRPRAAGGGAVRTGAVARRMAAALSRPTGARPHRPGSLCGCSGSSHRRYTGRPASASSSIPTGLAAR